MLWPKGPSNSIVCTLGAQMPTIMILGPFGVAIYGTHGLDSSRLKSTFIKNTRIVLILHIFAAGVGSGSGSGSSSSSSRLPRRLKNLPEGSGFLCLKLQGFRV